METEGPKLVLANNNDYEVVLIPEPPKDKDYYAIQQFHRRLAVGFGIAGLITIAVVFIVLAVPYQLFSGNDSGSTHEPPTIQFPRYVWPGVVDSATVPVIGSSDFTFYAVVNEASQPETLPVFFSKEKVGDSDQFRVEWHPDSRIAVYGFNIPQTQGAGWISPDNNGFSSALTSPDPVHINNNTSIALIRKGTTFALYVNKKLVAAIGVDQVYYLRNQYSIAVGGRHSFVGFERMLRGIITDAKFYLTALNSMDLMAL